MQYQDEILASSRSPGRSNYSTQPLVTESARQATFNKYINRIQKLTDQRQNMASQEHFSHNRNY
jgi:hypothetical protein